MIPTVQIAIKIPSSFGLMAFFNITIDGKLSVVTPIMKESTTPSFAPFASKASAIGIHPKISAYIGTPAIVAIITPNGFPFPRNLTIKSFGIQLLILAPIPTPISIYGNTFLNVSSTYSAEYFIRALIVSSSC